MSFDYQPTLKDKHVELRPLRSADYAFRFVNSVIFLIGLQNLRSQRAVEEIGGIRVGSRPDGGGRDSCIYRISAPPT